MRLRLEPASSIEDLQKLAWRYREARHPVREHGAEARAWPTDLLDYWLRHPSDLSRVAVYKLDPAKGPLAPTPPDSPQELSINAVSLDRSSLKPLIQVDFVPAQRGLGTEEAIGRPGSNPHRVGLFSNQMLRFAQQNLNSTGSGSGHHPDLIAAVAKAQGELDTKIRSALEPTIEDVKILGYPGLHDPQDIHFRTRIQTANLLDHSTAVQYRLGGQTNDVFLPEYAIGLGYQNLQSLSYQLVSFRNSRLNPEKGSPAAVHLVLLEEPEAHLHVQVQRVFPRRASELINPKNSEYSHLSSQLILSTHASHLAHSESFTRLRYVRRLKSPGPDAIPSSEVIDLADVFGGDIETRTFAERYFQIQHTDLLFADAAVFVEGTAERILVPFFIERDFVELRGRYISYLDIGGSHAHRLKPLLERLGLPIVVVTDIDPVKVTKNETGKTVTKAEAIDDPKNRVCGNHTLRKWHPKLTQIQDFAVLQEKDKVWANDQGACVRFAWQEPITPGGPWPSSLEDAFILSNSEWFKGLVGAKGELGKVARSVKKHSDPKELNQELHKLLHGSFSKGNFAATLFERLSDGEALQCPDYITDALIWLQNELTPVGIVESKL